MTSHCKTSDVSHVYLGSGYTPIGFVYFAAKQVLRPLVSPTLQILKTGSVDSWLPSLAHQHTSNAFNLVLVSSAMLRGHTFK